MTLEQDREWLIRLLGALVWLAMSLAFCIELCAILGWFLGQGARGACLGPVLACLFWLWLLWDRG